MKRFSALITFAVLSTALPAVAQDEAIEVEGPPPQLSGLQAEVAEAVGDKQKLT